jgi:signal transduction histidine kinase/DNA-binding response OmpR family regulator/ligand-binding sensor domain-containing protein
VLPRHAFFNAVQLNDDVYFASDGGRLYRYRSGHFFLIKFPTSSSINLVLKMNDDNLLVTTPDDGCFLYNPARNSIVSRYKPGRELRRDAKIQEAYIDRCNDVWVSYDIMGVTHINTSTGQSKYFILKDKYGNAIVESKAEMSINEDCNGWLWLQPAGGGFAWYDRDNDMIVPFYNSSALAAGWSRDNKITKTFSDRQGNLWICSYSNGVEKVTFNTSKFMVHTISSEHEYSGNNTRALLQDPEGRIWIGSKDKIIRVYDEHLNAIGNLSHDGTVKPDGRDEFGCAYDFQQDHNGTIWIATRGQGLFSLTKTNQSPLRYSVKNYQPDDASQCSINSKQIFAIHEDSHHRLWVASFDNGLCYVNLDDSELKFTGIANYPQQYRKVRFVTSDKKGRLLVGTTGGLMIINEDFTTPDQIKFECYQREPSNRNSLSCNDVHSILPMSNGDIYISTFGGGIDRLSFADDGPHFTIYSIKNGLPSDMFMTAIDDKDGNIWFASEEDICKYSPTTGKIDSHLSRSFAAHINFNDGDAIRTSDGRLLFNTTRGIMLFSPADVKRDDYVPTIVLTEFNRPRNGNDDDEPLVKNIENLAGLKLPHDKNGFSISFAALDMRYPASIKYAYMLEGFESEWNYIDTRRTATYTNLPKGNYTLKIKSTNSSGVWVDNVRSLKITILPSFWETIWAYILYVVIALVVIFVAAYILFVIFRLKQKISVEQEISNVKLKLFTDISHELRTPLTLILGPVEEQLGRTDLSEKARTKLELVYRNVNRMVSLVNQILDLRKIHGNKMKMFVQQINVVDFVKQIMFQFNGIAERRHINFGLNSDSERINLWVDPDKMEKIIFNLLSNAFKYTPDGQNISVAIVESDRYVNINISDSGVGISEAKRKVLFNRFEAFGSTSSYSTGIGLSLVKELVDMHNGEISVDSNVGKGSKFCVKLLKGREHFDESVEFIVADGQGMNLSQQPVVIGVGEHKQMTEASADSEKETLLIVEDNDDLRIFLRDIFESQFNILEASDGEQGLKECQDNVPDIIITDVMMPGMNGIEMTKAIRSNIQVCHIPIFILTAKSDIDSKLDGLHAGASDYITKPFSTTYLKAKVQSFIEQRNRMREQYMNKLVSPDDVQTTESESRLSANDKKFMDNLMDLVDNNMDNGELMIDDLARDLGVSRSVLFKKLKTLTGLSPNEFIKEIRIKHAAKLIIDDEYSMAQIAYMTGFNDSHYFSKCFKKYFGVTPTEYKDGHKRD